ncbi:MAG: RNA 2',3'-cyclic phosphodiesterase [Bacteroidota bacterium]
MIRTFIAIDTPAEIKEKMFSLQSLLKQTNADVKWEAKEKFHATIKFLGDVDERQLSSIVATIKNVVDTFLPIELTFEGIGSFPNRIAPRVVWIGCENEDGQLRRFKNALDKQLSQFGFEIENRKFYAHITLGRVKGNRNIKDLLLSMENLTFSPQKIQCSEILVMKSVLLPQGSEYFVLQKIPFRKTNE